MIAFATLLIGCGTAPRRPEIETKPPADPRSLEAGAGSFLRRANAGDSVLWSVRWDRAALDYEGEGSFGGEMEGVSGSLYENGKAASGFRARKASADKAESWLKLSGQVVVESKTHSARLQCSEVLWDADSEIIKAKGGVRLATESYSVGPFHELWTTPELEEFSTPDLFKRSRGKGLK